jgi:hypothetical protein
MILKALAYLAILSCFCVLLWGGFWVAKHGSYAIWYRDMVRQTVQEMVKPEALK